MNLRAQKLAPARAPPPGTARAQRQAGRCEPPARVTAAAEPDLPMAVSALSYYVYRLMLRCEQKETSGLESAKKCPVIFKNYQKLKQLKQKQVVTGTITLSKI
jgi:hypothetical protein